MERVRAPVLAAGLIEEAEFDAALVLFDDPETAVMSHLMMAAWDRRGRWHARLIALRAHGFRYLGTVLHWRLKSKVLRLPDGSPVNGAELVNYA